MAVKPMQRNAPGAPPINQPAELRSAEPGSLGERASMMLDHLADGPISSALVGAVKGAAGAPIMQTLLGLPAVDPSGDFRDFLTDFSAVQRPDKASNNGRMIGSFVPEAVAYGLTSLAGSGLGAAATKIGSRSAAVERYFRSLGDPRIAGAVKPAIVRAGEILGSAVASGGLAGAEDLAMGGEDPLGTALKVGALSLGIEGGLTVGGKLLSRGARELDKGRIVAGYAGSEPQQYLRDNAAVFRKKLLRQVGRVRTAIAEEAVERDLQGMVPVLPTLTGKQMRSFAIQQQKGLQRAVGERIEQVRKMHQASGALQTARRFAGISERDILAGAYLSEHPTNFDSTFGSMRRAMREAFATPDGIRKELGVAGEFGIRSTDNAVLLGYARANSSLEILKRVKKAMERRIGGGLSREALLTWEEAGEQGVRDLLASKGHTPQTADVVLRQLGLVEDGMDALHNILVRFGAEPAIDRTAMRVEKYLPQTLQRTAKSDASYVRALEKHLQREGFSPQEATRRALDLMEAKRARGYQFFGSVDERRLIPGSTRRKLEIGVPLEPDPWHSIANYFVGTHNRIALSQVLGFRGEMIKPLVSAVEKEAGPGAASLFRTNLEAMAGLKYYNRLSEAFANSVTNLEAAAKMGLSFVPNAFQAGMNNPLVFGMRNTLEGMGRLATGAAPADLKRATGFMATDFFDLGLRSHMLRDMRQGITSKLARMTLSGTPFNMSERFNRGSAAFAAHASLTDILAKASTGKLRGERLTFARKVFEEAGLSLDETLRKGITQEEYITGVMRLMRRTQFSAGEATKTIRPTRWQSPTGRIVTQFGTFTLNQSRLMRDMVFNEIAKGNKRQLARFLGIYMPTADVSVWTQNRVGEALTGMERERPDNPLLRAIEDMIYAGSFGMANTMFWAAKNARLERLSGPAVTDFLTYGNALLDGRFNEVMRRLVSLPSVKYFSAMANIAHKGGDELFEAASKYQQLQDAEGESETPGDQLKLRDFQQGVKPMERHRQ